MFTFLFQLGKLSKFMPTVKWSMNILMNNWIDFPKLHNLLQLLDLEI